MSSSLEQLGTGNVIADCWTNIKRETGFDTYEEYIGIHENEQDTAFPLHTRFPVIPSRLRRASLSPCKGCCSVLDLSDTGTLSNRFAVSGSKLVERSTELLTIIRQPDPQTIFRVLLLDGISDFLSDDVRKSYPSHVLRSRPISAIGLGLRVPREVFELLYDVNSFPSDSRSASPEAGYVAIGAAVLSVARNYLPDQPHCPPVVLVMGTPISAWKTHHAKETPIFDRTSLADRDIRDRQEWPESFELLFSNYIQQCRGASLSLDQALLYALLSLLKARIGYLKEAYDGVNYSYTHQRLLGIGPDPVPDPIGHSPMAKLGGICFNLRRDIHAFDKCAYDCTRFLHYHSSPSFRENKEFLNIKEAVHRYLETARALEAEIRDCLQLEVGSLALQESKKSIELSSLQIEESKRGETCPYCELYLSLTQPPYSQDW